VQREPKPPAGADISTSQRLVCVGRGLARAEDLPLVQQLAEALGAELACTRPLSYEYGWLPEERMVGISGRRTSPRLMLSLGVSGQVQHTVGIMGSKVIVAVNREASAPIFKLADYGIVADLYQLAPRLTDGLRGRTPG
jgi:electron transfer flavoprotein alpha subunit